VPAVEDGGWGERNAISNKRKGIVDAVAELPRPRNGGANGVSTDVPDMSGTAFADEIRVAGAGGESMMITWFEQ
jgi:hypothetical protein